MSEMNKFVTDSQNLLLSESRKRLIINKLAGQLPQIFGYNALLYTPLADEICDQNLLIKKQVVIGREKGVDVKCRFKELPIASDCIDLAVLPAILQATGNPHQVLREVERVLIPEGMLILIGRNPFSWLGIRNWVRRWLKKTKHDHRDISRSRIKDWFRLLGLETEIEINISVTNEKLQASNSSTTSKRLGQTFCDYLCSYYIIIARKKVSTMTPIRPSWRRNKQLVPSRLAEPSVRSQVEHWFKQFK